MIFLTLIILFGLLLLGVPIAVALMVSGLTSAFLHNQVSGATAALVAFASVNSGVLLAVPMYILAGELLSRGRLIRRLVQLAEAVLGWIPRGTAVAAVATSVFFAGITGSSAAEAAAIGSLMYPALSEAGYPKRFSAALLATAATFGILIPPSLTMILFGSITQTSVSKLFMAGLMPGLVLGLGLSVLAVLLGRRFPVHRGTFDLKLLWRSFKSAGWILAIPVIVVGGIYGGLFTPTEAAAVVVVYALFVSTVVYKNVDLAAIRQACSDTARTTAMIYVLIIGSTLLSFAVTADRLPQQVAEWITAAHLTPLTYLMVINALLLFLGLFFDGLTILVMTLPVLYPAAAALGINPFHLAVVMTVNIEIGVLTPPVGMNLFVISSVAGLKVEEVVKGLVPFYLFMVAGLLLVTYWPPLSLWLTHFVQ